MSTTPRNPYITICKKTQRGWPTLDDAETYASQISRLEKTTVVVKELATGHNVAAWNYGVGIRICDRCREPLDGTFYKVPVASAVFSDVRACSIGCADDILVNLRAGRDMTYPA